ncbi:gamma-soluble NSF attachment protein-like [Trichogramma pretiosum]|uniref:gamma-soluble NSF attachment protein-like n=1 Tax=Trichogramma pretiosum TaxID=7493 RepID=UPI0006C94AA0|nr:gamma-soluble NSF attachment protein-like [Trichogramma pretiosum]
MSKIEEGNAHIRNAEKCLKTSLIKWRPDFDSAADEYSAAATCFRVVKNHEQCKECLMLAAKCYKENRSWFQAAKCYEQVVLCLRELNQLSGIPKLAHNACSLYQQHGSPESGATVLDKSGKIIEQTLPDQALELYSRAAEIVLGEDSPRQAAEYMSKVARLLVKLGKYDQAADAVRREIGMHQQIDHTPSVGRLAVVLVLVQLARGDQIAAEKAFKEFGGYCEAPEVQTLEMLLQAYDSEDADAARSALNSPFIKHMDIEYAKLARTLALPQQEYAVPPAGVRANAAPSYISPNVNNTAGPATVEAEVNQGTFSSSNMNSTDVASAAESNFDSNPEPSQSAPPEGNEDEEDYEGGLC